MGFCLKKFRVSLIVGGVRRGRGGEAALLYSEWERMLEALNQNVVFGTGKDARGVESRDVVLIKGAWGKCCNSFYQVFESSEIKELWTVAL